MLILIKSHRINRCLLRLTKATTTSTRARTFECRSIVGARHFSSSERRSEATTASATQTQTTSSDKIPSAAKVVICGGGLIGTSVAYHLAELGYKDVVLVTRDKLGSGATSYSTGVLGLMKLTPSETLLSKYSSNLYEKLQNEGHQLKYEKCGSIGLSTTRDRWHTIKRQVSEAKTRGIECHLLSAEECHDKFPAIRHDDLEGGVWVPQDGTISPIDLLHTLASESKKNGINIIEHCEVTKVLVKETRGGQYYKVKGVETTRGTIECDIFVNCAGIRARELGKLSTPRVKVPVHACEHYHCVIKPMNIPATAPIIRDYDGCIYMRYNEGGGLVFGGFEKDAKPVFHEGCPRDFENRTLPPDLDHFYPLLKSFIKRVPGAVDAEVEAVVNSPMAFTPDTRMIMGESAEVDGYFVAAGTNADVASLAGGVGRHIAEIIAFGETDIQLWPVDVRRFVKLHNNRKFLRDRVKETVGKQYSLKYPTYGMSLYHTGRKLRTSPLYTRLLAHGAVYGEILGYERPLWFDSSAKEFYIEDMGKGSFGKPQWFEIVRDEYMACRRGVAIMDMSSFTKFELKSAGREVIDFLQYICSNDVDSPVGHVIHTGMQNHKGGYENDCSVVKLEPNCYMIISPVTQQTRNMKWLSEHFPEDGSVLMSDITSLYAAINVVGPKAIELLSELTDESLSTTDFPQFTCKEIDIGYASGIKAMRLTHTGEDGFILYVPTEYALHVYDTLMERGRNYGVMNAGYYALRALRIEKMLAFWGQDLDKNTTPYECGRDFRVKLDRKDFIGKMALLQLKSERMKRRFVHLVLDDHDLYQDPWPWGGEPIYRNDKFCGYTTSTTYGFTLGKQVCLGFVHNFDENTGEKMPLTMDYLLKNATYEVDIANKRYKAKLHIYPPNLNINVRS